MDDTLHYGWIELTLVNSMRHLNRKVLNVCSSREMRDYFGLDVEEALTMDAV